MLFLASLVVMVVALIVAGQAFRRLAGREEEHLWQAALREFPLRRDAPVLEHSDTESCE